MVIGQEIPVKLDRDQTVLNTERIVKVSTVVSLNGSFDVRILYKHRRELVIWPVR